VIAAEARDNDKETAARLALLLAQHDDVGSEFLALLDVEIPNALLLERVSESLTMAARGAYLELACALDRTADDRFVAEFVDQRWLASSLAKLRGSDALSALEALRAYARFLEQAGVPFKISLLLDEAQPDGKWGRRLRQLHHPGQLSQALSILRKMSQPVAAAAVVELDTLFNPRHWLVANETKEARSAGGSPNTPAPRPRPIGPTIAIGEHLPTGATASSPTPATVARARRWRVESAPGLTRMVQRHFVHPDQAIELIHAVHKIDAARARGIGHDLTGHASWNARVRGTLDSESPLVVGQALLRMSRSNMWLEDRHMRHLEKEWLPLASRIRSPAAAETMLRGMVAADRQSTTLAEEWASRLNLTAVGDRLRRGARQDLDAAASLIGALSLWGPPDTDRQIAEAIPLDATSRLEPWSASRLLWALNRVDSVLASLHLEGAEETLVENFNRPFVLNRNIYRWHLGWYARQITAVDGSFRMPPVALEAAADISDIPTRGWVLTSLNAAPPRGYLDADATAILTWSTAARLGRLAAASRAGKAGAVLEADGVQTVSALIRSSGLNWQLELLKQAALDPELRAAFTPTVRADIADNARDELALGNPDAAPVEEALFHLD
jgi:hypothetical protein